MLAVSYLVGLNCAALAYFGALRHFRPYLGIPLTCITFAMARNLSLKGSINKVYYPVEPLYEEVRRHQTVSEVNPQGAKGIRDIERASQVISESNVPLTQRTDLTKADKRKIMRQTRGTRQ